MMNRSFLTIMLITTLGMNYASAMQPTAATTPTHNTEIATLTQALHDRLGQNSPANCLSLPLLQEIATHIYNPNLITVSLSADFDRNIIFHRNDDNSDFTVLCSCDPKKPAPIYLPIAPLSVTLDEQINLYPSNKYCYLVVDITQEQAKQIAQINFKRRSPWYCCCKIIDKKGEEMIFRSRGDPSLE